MLTLCKCFILWLEVQILQHLNVRDFISARTNPQQFYNASPPATWAMDGPALFSRCGGSAHRQAASVTLPTSSTERHSYSFLMTCFWLDLPRLQQPTHTHIQTQIVPKRSTAKASILFNEPDLFFASSKMRRGLSPVVAYRPICLLHFHPWIPGCMTRPETMLSFWFK